MNRPEVSWSIMHPVRPDPAFMDDVIAAAGRYRIDSFEICGDCHSRTGGLEGAIRFRDYPSAAARIDHEGIEESIRRLRAVVAMAHRTRRPVYYWHREVMVPRPVVETVAGLLDERGELDLLGDVYHGLLRSKLTEFFENLPEMDGVVLTVTESDYSVIHNSDPERYPPAEVVKRIIATFASELEARGKRFILRSFGSVGQDYEDILAGAGLASAEGHVFEIETKITPYDFSPFLPFNLYLKKTARATLSAEYDSIGEFLGAGFLPAGDPQRVIDSVNYARDRGVDRHTIRVDRIGHAVFSSPQAINLLAFDRAIADPGVTADAIWAEWARAHWPACATEMAQVMRRGIEMVKKTHFIDGHVIFHAFPIQPELKWIRACGILSVFSPRADLGRHEGMWGIMGDRRSPASRGAILAEKNEAVRIADDALAAVEALKERLPAEEFTAAETAWRNATVITRLIRAWCVCVSAYFDDMEVGGEGCASLHQAIAASRPEFAPFAGAIIATAHQKAQEHEYGAEIPADSIEAAYAVPIWKHINLLPQEYEAELAERRHWRALPGVSDFVVCGGLTDDHRVKRYMHASHAWTEQRPARVAGNRVFPNGFIECRLVRPDRRPAWLRIEGDVTKASSFWVSIDGSPMAATFDDAGVFEWEIPSAAGSEIVVRIKKAGAAYPWIHGMGLVCPV